MRRILVLSEEVIHRVLPVRECIAVMSDALAGLAREEFHQPLRQLVRAEDAAGFLGLMPAYRSGSDAAWGLKEVCVYPENPKRGLDSHLGAVLLHSGETGELLAVMNASAITAIRTAAVSGVATDLLARKEAADLAIIGTGVQARAHLEAMRAVRPLRRIRVMGRSAEAVEQFARAAGNADGIAVETAESVEQAVAGADLIVTATSSREPVLRREWIAAGAHINLIGSSTPSAREADGATLAAGKLYVDRRESTVNESGDYLFAVREGAITEDHIRGEIGQVLIGRVAGRESAGEITIFKSLGLAAEDLATAQELYRRAAERAVGDWVEW